MRADAMLNDGDLDGNAVWKRIVKAVDELLSNERLDTSKTNWIGLNPDQAIELEQAFEIAFFGCYLVARNQKRPSRYQLRR